MICYKILSEPMKIMNISSPLRTLPQLLAPLVALVCALPLTHAKVGEQENWYLANEWSIKDEYVENYWWSSPVRDVATYKDDSGVEKLYVLFAKGYIKIYDLGGNVLASKNINTPKGSSIDISKDGLIYYHNGGSFVECLDQDLNMIWQKGFTSSDLDGIQMQLRGLSITSENRLFVTHSSGIYGAATDQAFVLELNASNGTIINKFGSYGDAPSQLRHITGIASLPNGNLIIKDTDYDIHSAYLHLFSSDGSYINRVATDIQWSSWYDIEHSPIVRSDDSIWDSNVLLDSELQTISPKLSLVNLGNEDQQNPMVLCTSNSNDLICLSLSEKKRVFQLWKRVYRTKGLPTPNIVPQPFVRSVTQRPGTNILDIDFEIIDLDDTTATVGILATPTFKSGIDEWGTYQDNSGKEFNDLTKLIVPSSLTDGTDALIGQPIATNQVHRVSWYVKGDWNELTGDLKVGVFAQDARRSMPVDLHFLKIPTEDGNLTISRSPLKDSDMLNYFQYLLSIGDSRVKLENGKILNSNNESFVESIVYDFAATFGVTKLGRDFFMNDLGYQWATIPELSIARDAATPGTTNKWDATNQVKPRNLPKQVNEYGFDTGNHGTRAWWVIKDNELNILKFSIQHAFVDEMKLNQSNSKLGRSLTISNTDQIIVGTGGGNIGPQHFNPQSSSDDSYSFSQSTISTNDNSPFGFGVSRTIGSGDSEISKAISEDGGTLAVGSYAENAVYLFEFSSSNNKLEQRARITSSNSEQDESFGVTVALNNNILAIGAPTNNANGYESSGAVYVFRINEDFTYTQLAKLSNPTGEPNDQFGFAIAVSNEIIAIGANDYQRMLYHGDHGVFLYKVEGDSVRQTQFITPPGGNYSGLDHFGNSIAIENSLLFVGSHWGQTVSIFTLSSDGNAEFLKNIKTPNPTEEGFFGTSIAASGEIVVIGAPGEYSDFSIRDGVAYVYRVRSDGRTTLLDRLSHPVSQQLSGFGSAVSINNSKILVGAPGFDLSDAEPNVGSVVLFNSSN